MIRPSACYADLLQSTSRSDERRQAPTTSASSLQKTADHALRRCCFVHTRRQTGAQTKTPRPRRPDQGAQTAAHRSPERRALEQVAGSAATRSAISERRLVHAPCRRCAGVPRADVTSTPDACQTIKADSHVVRMHLHSDRSRSTITQLKPRPSVLRMLPKREVSRPNSIRHPEPPRGPRSMSRHVQRTVERASDSSSRFRLVIRTRWQRHMQRGLASAYSSSDSIAVIRYPFTFSRSADGSTSSSLDSRTSQTSDPPAPSPRIFQSGLFVKSLK